MRKEIGSLFLIFVVGLSFATLVAYAERASTPKNQDKVALAENDVKELLLLMDTNKNGKISRQEFMNFMAKEFDRLDKDKSGELDPQELSHSQIRASHEFSSAGK